MLKLKSLFSAAAVVAVTAVSAPSVFAAEAAKWDYTQITTGVDFSGIATGVLSVAAVLAGIYAGIKGARIVLGFLKR
ncbi:major coat protein [Pseudomonas phage PMBT54]|nr:major coat protein [Pseudomonas phage PMBT54]